LSLIVAGRKEKDGAFLRELPEHAEKLRGIAESALATPVGWSVDILLVHRRWLCGLASKDQEK
jgi:hypothetical protein